MQENFLSVVAIFFPLWLYTSILVVVVQVIAAVAVIIVVHSSNSTLGTVVVLPDCISICGNLSHGNKSTSSDRNNTRDYTISNMEAMEQQITKLTL